MCQRKFAENFFPNVLYSAYSYSAGIQSGLNAAERDLIVSKVITFCGNDGNFILFQTFFTICVKSNYL